MSRRSGEIVATGNVKFGDAHGSIVSGWLIHLTNNTSNSWTGDLQGKAKDADQGVVQTLAYKDMKSGTIKTAQLNTAGLPYLILVDASGLDIQLTTGALVSGGVYFDAHPVIG